MVFAVISTSSGKRSFSRDGCWQPWASAFSSLSSSTGGIFHPEDSNRVAWKAGAMDTADCDSSVATKCGRLMLPVRQWFSPLDLSRKAEKQ